MGDFQRELRPEAIAKRVYTAYEQRIPTLKEWESLDDGQQREIVEATQELLDEHVIKPGWILL